MWDLCVLYFRDAAQGRAFLEWDVRQILIALKMKFAHLPESVPSIGVTRQIPVPESQNAIIKKKHVEVR